MKRRAITPSKRDIHFARMAREPENRARRAALPGGYTSLIESPMYQARRRLWVEKCMRRERAYAAATGRQP